MTPIANLLQIRAAAEHAALASNDLGAHVRVARELQAGFAQIARGLHVERVEALAPVDRQDADAVAHLGADIRCAPARHTPTTPHASFSSSSTTIGPQARRI